MLPRIINITAEIPSGENEALLRELIQTYYRDNPNNPLLPQGRYQVNSKEKIVTVILAQDLLRIPRKFSAWRH